LTQFTDPNLLVGLQTSDDAAVYRLNDSQAIIQTIDFFPPVVDDPYVYGGVAAANSMSDVFAMGGEVLFALNVAAFPESLPLEILSRIMAGGADKVAEVGAVIAGGHTVTDEEPKYGLVVTGLIDPNRILTKAGARPGDVVFLTKPIGTGVITTANKQSACEPAHLDAAIEWMLKLNQASARLIQEVGVHCCTDITGYGLIGHASEVAVKSSVRLVLDARSVPLMDGAIRYAAEGRLPGGAGRNRAYYSSPAGGAATVEPEVPAEVTDLLFDPETSGGLLVTVSSARATALINAFERAGEPLWQVGHVERGRGLSIVAG
jgi:selenide, water dikinase